MNFIKNLASKLEEIDNQANEHEKVQITTSRKADPNFSDSNTNESSQFDFRALQSANEMAQNRISSLEEQNRKLSNTNSRLESELTDCQNQNEILSAGKQQLESQCRSLRTEIKALQLRSTNEQTSAAAEQKAAEDKISQLEKQISSYSLQITSLQNSIQSKTSENTSLSNECQAKSSEITSLEEELNRYRRQAQETLSQSTSDSASVQLAVLESEKTRLKERLTRAQQKAAQEEAARKEMEITSASELSDIKNHVAELESELFKAKTAFEASQREITNLKNRQIIERDAASAKARQQIEAEKAAHTLEITKLKQQYANEKSSNDGVKYIDALKQIDELKSEKAALLLMVEQARADNREIHKSFNQTKSRWVPLSSIAGKWESETGNALYNFLAVTENKLKPIRFFIEQYPLCRVFLFVWLIIVTLLLFF